MFGHIDFQEPTAKFDLICIKPFTWETNTRGYFRNGNLTVLFPWAINLFLNICSGEDMYNITSGKACLYITFGGIEKSRIQASVKNNPEQINSCQPNIPCEIMFGPFWHLLSIDRIEFISRRIEPYNTTLIGRDQYTIDENIADSAKDGIFIIPINPQKL